MVPLLNSRWLRACAAILCTALLYAFGTGLHPFWPLVWLAPLPCLLFAAREPIWTSLLISFSASLLSGLNLWNYLGKLFPPVLCVVFLVPFALVFTASVMAFRTLFQRDRLWLAWLVAPSTWVTLEWLYSCVSPHGTVGNLAYSQLGFLPVLQIASVVGPWGISFLVVALPTALAIAFLTLGRPSAREGRSVLLTSSALVAAALIAGCIRLGTTKPDNKVPVGLLASDGANVGVLPPGEATRALFRAYLLRAEPLVQSGARLIVLPEKLGVVELDRENTADEIFQPWADAHGVAVCAGMVGVEGGRAHNEARLYRPKAPVLRYFKHHLLPGFEGHLVAGTALTIFEAENTKWGMEICKDLDFTYPSRGYGVIGTQALIVPGWDFQDDWLFHGHMAVLRGIEFGYAVIRPAKGGTLYVSDPFGRIVNEVKSDLAPFTTLAVDVPIYTVRTVYSHLGNVFAWLCGLITLVGVALGVRRRAAT